MVYVVSVGCNLVMRRRTATGYRRYRLHLASLQPPPPETAPAEKTVSRPSAGQHDRWGEQTRARPSLPPASPLPGPPAPRPQDSTASKARRSRRRRVRDRSSPQAGAGRGAGCSHTADGLRSPSGNIGLTPP